MTRQAFIAGWRCGNPTHQRVPGGCWSSSHILFDQLQRDVATCAELCPCWRHTIIAYVQKRTIPLYQEVQNVTQQSKLSRAQVVQQQLKALQAEMAHLARFPEDDFPEHTVLMTQKTIKRTLPSGTDTQGRPVWDPYNGETVDQVYTYVLLKANAQWWMTGTNGHGINGASWDRVIDFVDGDDLIDVRTGLSVMNDAPTVEDVIGPEAAAKVVKFLEDPSTGVTGRERPTRDES